MSGNRRQFLKTVAVAGSASLVAGCVGGDGQGADGDEFPSDDIRWIVGASPGGGFDTTVRTVVEFIPNYQDADVDHIVDNVSPPREGFLELHRSDPDGYTIGSYPFEGFIGDYATGADIPDPSELTPVARMITTEYVIVAGAGSGIESIEDMQATDTVLWSTPGEGTTAWQSSIISAGLFDINVRFVNFEGMSEAVTAVLREDTHVALGPVTSPPIVEALNAGDVVPVVVFSEEIPDVAEGAPTAPEAGYEQLLSLNLNRSAFGPPDIPDDRLDYLSDLIIRTLEGDEMQQWAEENDEFVNPGGPEELGGVVQQATEVAQEFEHLLSDPDQEGA